jgi:hypothetical protein
MESIFEWLAEGRSTLYVSYVLPHVEYRQAMHAKLSVTVMATACSIQSKIGHHPQAIGDIAVVETSQLGVLPFAIRSEEEPPCRSARDASRDI